MCHEASMQMKDLLEGVEPNPATLITGLKLLATNQDRNFSSIEKKMDSRDKKTDDKLEEILSLLKEYKIETDKRFEQTDRNLKEAMKEQEKNCLTHKSGIDSKFKSLEESTEVLSFFQKRPKLFLITVVGVAVLIGYVLGNEFDIFSIFKVA